MINKFEKDGLYFIALGGADDDVGVPGVACQNRHTQFLCFCLVDDQRSRFDGYR